MGECWYVTVVGCLQYSTAVLEGWEFEGTLRTRSWRLIIIC